MTYRAFQQEVDLAYRMILGYDCNVVESKFNGIIAKGNKTIWYVCASREQAQSLFDNATKLVKETL